MNVRLLAISAPNWQNIIEFGKEYVRLNPVEGFATSYLTPDSPAAYPACLDFCNDPLYNLTKGHVSNSTFHHCTITFGVHEYSTLRRLRSVEILELENKCAILTASVETWYDLIVRNLTQSNNNPLRELLCRILLSLEVIGFREMFAKFEKLPMTGENLYFLKEVK
jgi:hypothetical protein